MKNLGYVTSLKGYYSKNILHNKFNLLLATLFLLLLVGPLADNNIYTTFISTLFLFTIILVVRATVNNKNLFMFSASIATLAFVLQMLIQFHPFFHASIWLHAVSFAIFAVFLAQAILILVKGLVVGHSITSDMIRGGICIYLLLGILWSLLYRIVSLFDQNAFSGISTQMSDFVYLSFITLTTVGYGDILPIHPIARSLATIEAIVGPIFLTVFMASLVGLYNAHKTKQDNV